MNWIIIVAGGSASRMASNINKIFLKIRQKPILYWTLLPFQNNPMFLAGIGILIILVAILGALFSVRSIVKIDPLKAIG